MYQGILLYALCSLFFWSLSLALLSNLRQIILSYLFFYTKILNLQLYLRINLSNLSIIQSISLFAFLYFVILDNILLSLTMQLSIFNYQTSVWVISRS